MKFLPASEACIAYYPQAKDLYKRAESAGCTKRLFIDGFAIIAEPHNKRVFVVQITPTGFATHPRSMHGFKVVRYDDDSWLSEPLRAYLIPGGWAPDKTGVLKPLVNSDLLYPNSDPDNATLLISGETDPAGEFMAGQSSYGNFYAVDPQDPSNIITWKATPTRHGKLLYGVGPQISGVDGNLEVVGFTPRIYKGGKVYMMGPKVNQAVSVDGLANPYGIIMGCAFRDGATLAVVAYTKHVGPSPARVLSVWTTTGVPANGEVYGQTPTGWREWFYTPHGDKNLPWFISDDGKHAVCSTGDELDITNLETISFTPHIPSIGTRSINFNDDSSDIGWSFNYAEEKVLSEAQGHMSVSAAGTITKGGRRLVSSSVVSPTTEIRGNLPDNDCADGSLTYKGEQWNCPGDCPCGFEARDPTPPPLCTSILDGVTINRVRYGFGILEGYMCPYTIFVPYHSGSWVFNGGTYWPGGVATTMTNPATQCSSGAIVSTSDDGTTKTVEAWSSFTYNEMETACPEQQSNPPAPYGGIRNVVEISSSSGTQVCPSTHVLEPYTITTYRAERKTCEYTLKYVCSK